MIFFCSLHISLLSIVYCGGIIYKLLLFVGVRVEGGVGIRELGKEGSYMKKNV